MDKDRGKRLAAEEAAKHVERGMTLGLGTGSTAAHFVDIIGARVAEGWPLKGVPTSEATRRQAESLGVEIIEPHETTVIDLAVDGADEADPQHNLIKGGGAALLREKVVAYAAKKFIVIADKSKRVTALGAFPLPVEISPYGWALTVAAMRRTLVEQGFQNAKLELRSIDGNSVKTDGGNLIIDCSLERINDPARLEKALNAIPGVLECGLFCGMTDMIIYGDEDGVSVSTL
ncbi:ribose-5-phosphate isomerase RpiA [Hyphococcus flavus]|uniref:Ribose-5-phosphate isomerase A n=1 Tax=Hyphococcus flavus TaxID=1866326 RepID=A0AAF0CEE0_9PROT|nr:ribose-5-phosphate isomerase RpiA [Hyphococcus flavus]WDI30029.1 ribose-5-phosphate isomerase RpiA [Hyphococcus flavus]